MNAGWIVLIGGFAGAIFLLAGSWIRRRQDLDLGTLSHQWMAEQRLGQRHDPQR